MAKRKRAPARHGLTSQKTASKTPPQIDAPDIHSPRSRRPTYTPELLAQARHDFEHTERSKEARVRPWDGAVHSEQHGSARKMEAPCAAAARCATAVHLRRKAEMLEASVAGSPPENISSVTANGQGAMPTIGDTVERLYRAVREELTAVESLRARLKSEPQGTQDAERTARTLSSLTETLQKLQRLKCAAPNTGSHDDDLPADIDEFRTELARRIEALSQAGLVDGDAEETRGSSAACNGSTVTSSRSRTLTRNRLRVRTTAIIGRPG